MKHETYLQLMRERLGMPSASRDELEEAASSQMQREGFLVFRDQLPDGRFRVRVRRMRHGQNRFLRPYNVHTTSTSGYPILAAWEKWQDHIAKGGEA